MTAAELQRQAEREAAWCLADDLADDCDAHVANAHGGDATLADCTTCAALEARYELAAMAAEAYDR